MAWIQNIFQCGLKETLHAPLSGAAIKGKAYFHITGAAP